MLYIAGMLQIPLIYLPDSILQTVIVAKRGNLVRLRAFALNLSNCKPSLSITDSNVTSDKPVYENFLCKCNTPDIQINS